MRARFITATGTHVGKTLVTAALTWQGRQRGLSVRACKPLVTGFDPACLPGSDPAVLLEAMGLPLTAAGVATVSPVRFRAPLSPDMAAAREGAGAFDADVLAFSRQALAGDDDVVLVEGIGGVMVPFGATTTVRDWIAALSLDAVLVASAGLGTLSHTLASLEALAGAGVRVSTVVISEEGPPAVPLEETRQTLRRYAPSVRVTLLPHIEGIRPWQRAPEGLWSDVMEVA